MEGLLTQAPVDDSATGTTGWPQRRYQELYDACVSVVDGSPLPARAADLTKTERRRLVLALRLGWPPGAADAYAELCRAVSTATADAWNA